MKNKTILLLGLISFLSNSALAGKRYTQDDVGSMVEALRELQAQVEKEFKKPEFKAKEQDVKTQYDLSSLNALRNRILAAKNAGLQIMAYGQRDALNPAPIGEEDSNLKEMLGQIEQAKKRTFYQKNLASPVKQNFESKLVSFASSGKDHSGTKTVPNITEELQPKTRTKATENIGKNQKGYDHWKFLEYSTSVKERLNLLYTPSESLDNDPAYIKLKMNEAKDAIPTGFESALVRAISQLEIAQGIKNPKDQAYWVSYYTDAISYLKLRMQENSSACNKPQTSEVIGNYPQAFRGLIKNLRDVDHHEDPSKNGKAGSFSAK